MRRCQSLSASRNLVDRNSNVQDATLSGGPGGRPIVSSVKLCKSGDGTLYSVEVTDVTTNKICEIEFAPGNQSKIYTSKMHIMYQRMSLLFVGTMTKEAYNHQNPHTPELHIYRIKNDG